MPDRSEQASAYLHEAETTLQSARVLFKEDPDAFASQVVKNGYDAFEQALSAGIAARGDDIPMRHGAKIQQYFNSLNADDMEQMAFEWHGRRSNAQYVDFRGSDLSVPSENFDREDAAKILTDAEKIFEFVQSQMDGTNLDQ